MTSNIPTIAVVGETASGKSGLAHQVALLHGGEIICADSRTIYRGMDIGTAKPTAAQQKEVPYHGLDLVEPGEKFSAADYQSYAMKKIQDIKKRSKIPILVGGTGLYIDAVLFKYSFEGQNNELLRRQLDNESTEDLAQKAEEGGFTLSPDMRANRRHLLRLLERGTQNNDVKKAPINTLTLGIKLSRSQLRKNIEARVEQMFRSGLRKEYNTLKQNFGIENEAMTGIGYREFAGYEAGDRSMMAVKRDVVQNTIKYAKRQRTWFKRNPYIVWVESQAEGLQKVSDFLDK